MDFSLTRLSPRFIATCLLSLLAIVASAGSGIIFAVLAVLLFAGTLVFDIGSRRSESKLAEDTEGRWLRISRSATSGLPALAAAAGLSIFHGLISSYIIIVVSQDVLLYGAIALGGKSRRTWTSVILRYLLLVTILAASLEGLWSKATQAATGAQLALTPFAVLTVGHSILRFSIYLGRRLKAGALRILTPLVTMIGFIVVTAWLGLNNFIFTDPDPEYDAATASAGKAANAQPAGPTDNSQSAGADGVTSSQVAALQAADISSLPATVDEAWINAALDPSPLTLGPVLGAASPDSIRIWIATDSVYSATVIVKTMDGKESGRSVISTTPQNDMTGWVEIKGLSPRTQYVYDIVDYKGNSIVPSQLREWCSFITFPPEGSDTPLRYMVASCHRPLEETDDYYSGKFLPERFVMWEALTRQHKKLPMDFMLLLGDQAYNDLPFFKNLPDNKEWEKLQSDPAYKALREQQARKDFRDNYVRYWNHPSMRKAMAAIPSFMMWDDHDTRDGWGSMPEDAYDPKVLWVANIASEVDDSFQGAANPDSYPGKRYFNFKFGNTAFFVPDLRTYRKEYESIDTEPLMGKTQWSDIDAWFSGPAQNAKNIFLGLSVPMADAPGWVVDWLSQDRSGLGDDFRDKWYYKQNRPEMVRLMDRMFTWQKNTGGRAFTLGGDSHIALLGRLSDRSIAPGTAGREIYELTSSGISNQDTTAQVSYFLFKTFFGKTWMGEHYQSQVLKIVNNLNYGVVEVLPTGTSLPGSMPAPSNKGETRFWIAEEIADSKAKKTGLPSHSPDLLGYHLFMTSAGADSKLLPADGYLALPPKQ